MNITTNIVTHDDQAAKPTAMTNTNHSPTHSLCLDSFEDTIGARRERLSCVWVEIEICDATGYRGKRSERSAQVFACHPKRAQIAEVSIEMMRGKGLLLIVLKAVEGKN